MEPAWLQILLGAAAAVTVLGVLFGLANAWMMGRIKSTVNESLSNFKAELFSKLEEGYVPRNEYQLMERHGNEVHERHDKEIDQIWSKLNGIKAK